MNVNKKGIFWGVILILIATYYLVGRLGLLPDLPFFKLLFTVILGYTLIEGIVKLNFYSIFFSLALLGCIYAKPLGITAITPWPVLIAALLFSIGFSMIFRSPWGKKYHERVEFSNGTHVENGWDGAQVHFSNTFGESSKYINSENFSRADLNNAFGECNVYFNNAIMKNAKAEVHASNNFGELNLFFPGTWRVEIKSKTFFGAVSEHGMTNSDVAAPYVLVLAEGNFGEINIHYV